jgi:type IV secretion system protein VirB4
MTSLDLALSPPTWRMAPVCRREVPERDHIPYACHYDEQTLLTKQEDLLQVIQLIGLPFETADDELLVLRKNLRNSLVRSVADSRFAIYAHTVRRSLSLAPEGSFADGFAQELDQRWRQKQDQTKLFVNELYVTLVRRSALGGKAQSLGRWLERISHKRARAERESALRVAHKELHSLTQRFLASLQEYQPSVLGLTHREGATYSRVAQFLGMLVNLEDRPVRLPKGDLSQHLPCKRLYFGRNALEVASSSATDRKLAAVVSVKHYGPETFAGLLDRFLRVPREFVIAQSFVFEDRPAALARMQTQQRRMVQTEDLAASQLDGIDEALDDATAGNVAFGNHHLTILALESTLSELDKAVADFDAALIDIGVTAVREDLNLEPAFWAQLPGNFAYMSCPG